MSVEEMNPKVKEARWLCTHGMQDGVLPYAESKSQVEVLQNGGFDIEFRSYVKEHTIDRDELELIGEWLK